MANELHCPSCKVRITPYEYHHDEKKGHSCWNCGLPMSEVLEKNEQGIRELAPPAPTVQSAEAEIERLKAEIEAMKKAHAGYGSMAHLGPLEPEPEALHPVTSEEYQQPEPPTPHRGALPTPPHRPQDVAKPAEPAQHRKPGRPAGKK